MTVNMNEKVIIEIDKAQAEARVLWDICSILESVLVEPFMANYTEIIQEARTQLRDLVE